MALVGDIEKRVTPGGYEETQNQKRIFRCKLNESRKKLGPLIVADLLVCPILFLMVTVSLWIELDFPSVRSSGLCILLNHLNGPYLICWLLLWFSSHFCDMLLLLAITTDNRKYCRIYGATIGPIMEILTLFFFALLMWSSLSNLPNYTTTKFLIIVCSVFAILANFYNYLINCIADHYHLLIRVYLTKYKAAQSV